MSSATTIGKIGSISSMSITVFIWEMTANTPAAPLAGIFNWTPPSDGSEPTTSTSTPNSSSNSSVNCWIRSSVVPGEKRTKSCVS